MHAWEAIQNAITLIEENLAKEIQIDALARGAALSPYYFQRLFARLVKKPVSEYIKLRRLAKASEALRETDNRILDVALTYGFSGHANFTRAFKAAYGVTPGEYRKHPVILNQFIKPDLLLQYVMVEEDVTLLADGMVVEVTRRRLDQPRSLIGISGELPISELTGGRATGVATAGLLWDAFHRQKPGIPQLLPGGNEYGILYLGDAQEGFCMYLAGAEAASTEAAGEYAAYTLPCGDYVVCCFEAQNFAELIGSAVFKASSFMNTWMNMHGLICGDFAAEIYYGTTPDACYMEQWLPIRINK